MDSPTFVILSFEGPDPYSHAGGLGSRVTEMSTALSSMGFETHLFFIGDPHLPGHEVINGGRLHLHRWCQWISQHHPVGVYDGEEGKLADWERSLPAWLEANLLAPKIAGGGTVVIMAEEWQTATSVLALRRTIDSRGWQRQAHLLWNANNTFSFHRIDWQALRQAATITTVSRYMKHVMWGCGVDARVIPNGISDTWLEPVDIKARAELSRLLRGRLVLAKVARWDPDKRWDMVIDAVTELKRLALRPLLLARGGVGAHKHEVIQRAARRGLEVATASWSTREVSSLAQAMRSALHADMIDLQGYLSLPQRRALFHSADAVLANSGIEPFGLVGLETMAVGGVAFVGCTGEDYMTPGHDAISIQTNDPNEIVHHAVHLKLSPEAARQIRRSARRTAERYTWSSVTRRVTLPFLREKGVSIAAAGPSPAPAALDEAPGQPAGAGAAQEDSQAAWLKPGPQKNLVATACISR